MALNHIREKVKLQSKLSFRLLKEEDVYDPLIDISIYPILIHLNITFTGSDIVLQLLVNGFLIVMFLFHFLSQKTIWGTVEIIKTKQKEWMVQNIIESN